jgi:hypothetical protein
VKGSAQLAGVLIFTAVIGGIAAPASAQAAPASAQAPPASAQPVTSPNLEASIGYQLLHIPGETYPFGFNVDVSRAVNDRWRLVGELGLAMDEQNESGVSGDLSYFHFGGGPRLVAPMGRVQPFVQLLAGAVHPRASLLVNGTPVDDNDWAFMLQPGAGISIPAGNVVSVFGQADYRRAFFREEGENEFRFSFGVRFGLR